MTEIHQIPSRTKVLVDLQHKFEFDPTFQNVHEQWGCELEFFCEIFSFVDSMKNKNLFLNFCHKIKQLNGVIDCKQMIELLQTNDLIEKSQNCNDGLHFLLDNIYLILWKIISDGFVNCLHTSSLGCSAWSVGELYEKRNTKENGKDLNKWENINNNNLKLSSDLGNHWEEKAQAWKQLAEKLQDLAKYQQNHMRIYSDFQKSIYADDPSTKGVYGSTCFLMCFIFYFVINGFNFTDAKCLAKLILK